MEYFLIIANLQTNFFETTCFLEVKIKHQNNYLVAGSTYTGHSSIWQRGEVVEPLRVAKV